MALYEERYSMRNLNMKIENNLVFRWKTPLLVLLTILNISFIVYYFVLIYYNRLSQDDHDFLYLVKELGVFGFVKGIYFQHQGRFAAFFIHGLTYFLIDKLGSFMWVPILAWLVCFGSIYYVISKVFIAFPKMLSLLLSALLINIMLLINLEFSSFFWIASCSSFVLVLSPPLILLVSIFYNEKKISYLWIFLMSLLIGGGSEAFSPLILFLLLFVFCLLLIKHKGHLKDFIRSEVARKIIFSSIIILIGLIIVYIAPGNANRLATYQQPTSVFQFLWKTIKNFIVLWGLLSFKMPYIIFSCFLFFVLGTNIKWDIKLGKLEFFISLGILLFVAWISTFPAAYAMFAFGFPRIYTPIVFWVLLYFSFWSFVLGSHMSKKRSMKKKHYMPLCISIGLVTVIQIANIVHDTPIAKAYSLSDQKRVQTFLAQKELGNTEPIYFDALPNVYTEDFKSIVLGLINKNEKKPRLYYPNEIDTQIVEGTYIGYSNCMIMRYYELPFPIYRKQEE